MEKKIYEKPTIQAVELASLAIMAGSGELSADGTKGDLNTTETADANTAFVSSNQYFDTWGDDEE